MIGSAGLSGRLRARQRAHLDALLRVGHRVLVGDLGQAQALHADAQARPVHHHEHRLQALVRLADQPAVGAVEDRSGRWRCRGCPSCARGRRSRCRCARRACRRPFDIELRHDEQRDALRARRRIGQARQHQVHDVLGHVVLAGGDEDLLAGEPVAAVGLRLGLACAAGRGRCRNAARSGTSCRSTGRSSAWAGTAPSARRSAVLVQALVGAVRQARVHRPGLVGRVQHLVERTVTRCGRPWPPYSGSQLQRRPAAFDELRVGLLEALRASSTSWRRLVERAALFVAAAG